MALLLGVVVLGERLTLLTGLGALLILGGVSVALSEPARPSTARLMMDAPAARADRSI